MAQKRSRVVAPVLAHHTSAARGRLRRSVEQQELWHKFVDKLVRDPSGAVWYSPSRLRVNSQLSRDLELLPAARCTNSVHTEQLGVAAARADSLGGHEGEPSFR